MNFFRPMGVPEERGSKKIVDDQNQEHSFILGESRAFPIEILFGGKVGYLFPIFQFLIAI